MVEYVDKVMWSSLWWCNFCGVPTLGVDAGEAVLAEVVGSRLKSRYNLSRGVISAVAETHSKLLYSRRDGLTLMCLLGMVAW